MLFVAIGWSQVGVMFEMNYRYSIKLFSDLIETHLVGPVVGPVP